MFGFLGTHGRLMGNTFKMMTLDEATPTSTGTLSYTDADFGGTPTGCIILMGRDTAYNTNKDHENWSIVVSDGGRSRVIGAMAEDNQGTHDVSRWWRHNTQHVHGQDEADVTKHEATNINMVADGIEIVWSIVDTVAHKMQIILLGGVDCRVGDFTPNAADGGTVDVTGPGWTPGAIFLPSANRNNNGRSDDIKMSLGFVDSAFNQCCSYRWYDGGYSTSYMTANILGTAGHTDSTTEHVITSHASGFTCETTQGTWSSDEIAYLALRDVQSDIVAHYATGTGSTTVGSTSFQPLASLHLQSHFTSDAPVEANDAQCEEWGIGACSNTHDTLYQTSIGAFSEDGAGTSNTRSRISNTLAISTDTTKAEVTAYTASGVTLNYSAAGSRRSFTLLIGDPA